DFRQRHLDVASDDEALVEDAVQYVHETTAAASNLEFGSHGRIPCRPMDGTRSKSRPFGESKWTAAASFPEHFDNHGASCAFHRPGTTCAYTVGIRCRENGVARQTTVRE